jgi:hypothetical protein
MIYITLILIMLSTLYLISYARYSWKDNKLAAIGSIIMAILSFGLPVYVFLAG